MGSTRPITFACGFMLSLASCTSPETKPEPTTAKAPEPSAPAPEPESEAPAEDPAIATMTEVGIADLPAFDDSKQWPYRTVARRVKLTVTPVRVDVETRHTHIVITGTRLKNGDQVEEVATPADRADAIERVMDGVLRGYLRRQGSRRVQNRSRKAQGKEPVPEPDKPDEKLAVDLRTPAALQLRRLCDILPPKAPHGTYSGWPGHVDLIARAGDQREVRVPLVLVREGDGVVTLSGRATVAELVAAVEKLEADELERRVRVKLECES